METRAAIEAILDRAYDARRNQDAEAANACFGDGACFMANGAPAPVEEKVARLGALRDIFAAYEVLEMEARLKLSLFNSPQQGDVVGFDISTNDDDGGGTEESALFWTGEPPDIYLNEAVWGDLIFGKPYAVSSAGKLAITWGQVKKAMDRRL